MQVRGKRQPYHWWSVNFNWNAVCHAGCVGSALIMLDSKDERAEFIGMGDSPPTHTHLQLANVAIWRRDGILQLVTVTIGKDKPYQ
jgi:hypothetical protein